MSQELTLENQNTQLAIEERQFELLQRRGKMLAQSKMIPDSLRGNIADCCIIVEMAQRLMVDPFLIARQIYFVHGKPGFEAKFIIGQLNRSGLLKGRLKYKNTGKAGTDSEGCIAWGVDAQSGETIEGPEVTIKMAKDEGWHDKKDRQGNFISKWRTMPKLMLNYRAATFFVNTHCPELLSGFSSVDELHDVGIKDVDAEVTRHPHFTPEARELKVDEDTGEILNGCQDTPDPTQKDRQEQFETMQSPAFETLMVKLHSCTDQAAVDDLRKLPVFNRCTAAEREKFNERATEKAASF